MKTKSWNSREMNKSIIFLATSMLINIAAIPNAVAWISKPEHAQKELAREEDALTFVGRCPNGASYRIEAYEMDVDGLRQSFYHYAGPAGQGTVRTNTPANKMAVRVCRELADIADGSKYD
jgi:hypothetical protein